MTYLSKMFITLLLVQQVYMVYIQEQPDFKEQQNSIIGEFRNEKITLIPLAVTALDVTYYNIFWKQRIYFATGM